MTMTNNRMGGSAKRNVDVDRASENVQFLAKYLND